eukprot:GHVL01038880.1.p1 GENE.GHVL01038880.1~~GHVL01038880.1.p1  ORF type:complete len:866 (+),score=187.52 GHVL01038880.1:91-2688(+)
MVNCNLNSRLIIQGRSCFYDNLLLSPSGKNVVKITDNSDCQTLISDAHESSITCIGSVNNSILVTSANDELLKLWTKTNDDFNLLCELQLEYNVSDMTCTDSYVYIACLHPVVKRKVLLSVYYIDLTQKVTKKIKPKIECIFTSSSITYLEGICKISATSDDEFIGISFQKKIWLYSRELQCTRMIDVSLHNQQKKYSLNFEENITCIAMNHNTKSLACGFEIGSIRVWRILNLKCLFWSDEKYIPNFCRLHWHSHAVSSLEYSDNGAYLLSGGEEGVLVAWSSSSYTDQYRKHFLPRLSGPILYITPPNNEHILVTTHLDNSLSLINLNSFKIINSIHEMNTPLQFTTKLIHKGRNNKRSTDVIYGPIDINDSIYHHILPPIIFNSIYNNNILNFIIGRTGNSLQIIDIHGEILSKIDIIPKHHVARSFESFGTPWMVDRVSVSPEGSLTTVESQEAPPHHTFISNATRQACICEKNCPNWINPTLVQDTSTEFQIAALATEEPPMCINLKFWDRVSPPPPEEEDDEDEEENEKKKKKIEFKLHSRVVGAHSRSVTAVLHHPKKESIVYTTSLDTYIKRWRKTSIIEGVEPVEVWSCDLCYSWRGYPCYCADINEDGTVLCIGHGPYITLWNINDNIILIRYINPGIVKLQEIIADDLSNKVVSNEIKRNYIIKVKMVGKWEETSSTSFIVCTTSDNSLQVWDSSSNSRLLWILDNCYTFSAHVIDESSIILATLTQLCESTPQVLKVYSVKETASKCVAELNFDESDVLLSKKRPYFRWLINNNKSKTWGGRIITDLISTILPNSTFCLIGLTESGSIININILLDDIIQDIPDIIDKTKKSIKEDKYIKKIKRRRTTPITVL